MQEAQIYINITFDGSSQLLTPQRIKAIRPFSK
jgi:hypothetical protein